MTLLGIDVSKWQTASDWSPANIGFLFARATIGTQRDERYGEHIAKAMDAGLITGAYHFNVGSGISVADQADAFMAAAGNVDGYALDVEGKDAFTHDQARAFIGRLQMRGLRCGLYASESAFFDAGQDWDWVANWSNRPTRHYDVWQYGPFKGEDGDSFDGTPDELRLLLGGAMQPLVISSGNPKIVSVTVGDRLFNPDGSFLTTASVASQKPSPYEVALGGAHYRVLTVATGGQPVMALWHNEPGQITDPPAQDCSAEHAAGFAEAKAQALAAVAAISDNAP